ncbi:hypothetical protein [Streptomyces antarcticus]|uniref:hypothetical protein n=1 Tax=Streptomyces antarcticus TaxID=2996458 RepID=UPI0022AFE02E|nr:hypothetical protein [Streptomyces sp. H34-S5]MCZ4088514.1 hypothetical protein [Streptomyces sp. H34-S5]
MLAAIGWWVQWSGYEVVGLVPTLLAAAVVLGRAWRSGALHLPQAAEPRRASPRRAPSSARAKATRNGRCGFWRRSEAAADGLPGELSE